MSIFDPLLVPLDGSDVAGEAARVARTLARATGDTTLLLNVVEPGGPGWSEEAELGAMQRADEMLAVEAARFRTPVDRRVVTGEPAEAIARATTALDVGLLVMTPRGRGAIASVLLGSVSRDLIARCRTSILLVNAKVTSGHTVVCAVDSGPATGNVVAAARVLAQSTGSPLHVLHVINADPSVGKHPERFGIDPTRWAAARDAAVARAFADARPEFPPGTVEVVRYGVAVEEIARYAQEQGAEVVVVGRKGASGLDVDSFFSVAFGVATRGGFSTLIV